MFMSDLHKFAVVGGSQAYDLLSRGAIHGKRLGPRKTPFGPSQPVYVLEARCPSLRAEGEATPKADSPGRTISQRQKEIASSASSGLATTKRGKQPQREAKVEFLFLSRHGEKGYDVSAPFINYRANIYALKDMGVSRIVAWTGPGAINPHYKVGQFVVAHDVIDETGDRKSTFFEKGGLGFIRQNPVFCPNLRNLLLEVLKEQGLNHSDKGVYVCTQGPRLETPAEIKKFASYGGDLVGMTLVPEVFLARELEMCYAALCYVTNYAEGVARPGAAPPPFKAGELFEGLSSQEDKAAVAQAVAQFPAIILEVAQRQASNDRVACPCQSSMERYRREGRIGEDWRKWIR
jgi:5'-methylthioadenosine phosphorylase